MKQVPFLVVFCVVIGTLGIVAAQTTADRVVSPANAWQRTPTLYSAHDVAVPANIRAERDQFWDNTGATQYEPLTPETAAATAISDGTHGPVRREISEDPHRAIVIGTFMNFRSILTASGRCVYTDMIFRVDRVYESTSLQISPNSDITVSIVGGTVTNAAGKILSYLTPPRELFIQPFHRYLLLLSYHPVGGFFSRGTDWEVKDGVIHANDRYEVAQAKEGKSWIDGLTVEQFSRDLPSKLSAK
jgi:hypothetical protein